MSRRSHTIPSTNQPIFENIVSFDSSDPSAGHRTTRKVEGECPTLCAQEQATSLLADQHDPIPLCNIKLVRLLHLACDAPLKTLCNSWLVTWHVTSFVTSLTHFFFEIIF